MSNQIANRSTEASSFTIKERKHCWICNSQSAHDQFILPCKCNNNHKWVHRECLENLIDQKQRGNIWAKVYCPHCGFKYVVIYPYSGLLIKICDLIDEIISLLSPFAAGGFVAAAFYLNCGTFGAICVMQIFGYNEGWNLIKNSNYYGLALTLPSIPVALIFSRYVKWHEAILKYMTIEKRRNESQIDQNQPARNRSSLTFMRKVAGALLLPTISILFGELVCHGVQTKYQKRIMGGLVYLGIKGLTKIVYEKKKITREKERDIQNYEQFN